MTDKELKSIKQLLDSAENNIRQVRSIVFASEIGIKAETLNNSAEDKIVEGIFDGETMIGPDHKKYPIPSNYASKSKLVSGDVLKLMIGEDGTFLFKQIGPIKRKKLVGELEEIDKGKYVVKVGDDIYNILLASVTYFKASPGDKLTILIPEDGKTDWAAVENKIEEIS